MGTCIHPPRFRESPFSPHDPTPHTPGTRSIEGWGASKHSLIASFDAPG